MIDYKLDKLLDLHLWRDLEKEREKNPNKMSKRVYNENVYLIIKQYYANLYRVNSLITFMPLYGIYISNEVQSHDMDIKEIEIEKINSKISDERLNSFNNRKYDIFNLKIKEIKDDE